MPGPSILSLRKLGFLSDFLRWSSGQPVFLHGLDPGSNPGEAQIEEIVKFLVKTGRPRGSSIILLSAPGLKFLQHPVSKLL